MLTVACDTTGGKGLCLNVNWCWLQTDIYSFSAVQSPYSEEGTVLLSKLSVSNRAFPFHSLRVRGQHTKTTGRKGRTVGVAKKKS